MRIAGADLERLGNVAGKTTPRVPEHMAGVQLEYRRDLGGRQSWFAVPWSGPMAATAGCCSCCRASILPPRPPPI